MKRWWLPTQKGTDLFPRTTIMPPKVVVEGTEPGSPDARRIVAKYAGDIKRFHGKCQQAYSLSPAGQMKLQGQWPGARAVYLNVDGQEIIRIKVDQSVRGEELEITPDFWDYALIELYVPDMYFDEGALSLTCYAHLTAPIEAELDAGSSLPFPGVASNQDSRSTADPMINAAEADQVVRSVDEDHPWSYASFIVDLRPARGLSVVTADLYPYISLFEFTPAPSFGWGLGAVLDGSGDPIHGFSDYPPLGFPSGESHPSGVTQEEWDATRPPYHFDEDVGYWRWDEGAENVVEVPITGGMATYTCFMWEGHETSGFPAAILWGIATIGAPVRFSGPDRIPAEVQVTLFKGVPPFDVTSYSDEIGGSYRRWTFSDVFPRRPGHTTPGEVTVPTFSSDDRSDWSAALIDFFGVPKLGAVIIGLKTTEGATWQDA
jgi:hypothetical protein